MDVQAFIQGLTIWAIPVLLAITLHEAAHGYAAKKFGDQTAWMLGRVTLNPFKHIDPFGTILMPAALLLAGLPMIGYAKPVPVNFMRLKPRRFGSAIVALAGPMANLVLVFVSIAIWHLTAFMSNGVVTELIVKMCFASVQINILLMVFNMLPLPPLDGSRVLGAMLPPSLEYHFSRLDRIGMIVVILLAISGILFKILLPMMNVVLKPLIPLLPM